MKPLLEDKVVLITGAASGIGRECALACVRDGARVMIADVNAAQAEETAHDLGEQAAACFCDVADGATVECVVRETLTRFGRLDAVHNNAGIASPSLPLEETTEKQWDLLMAVNVKSIYWTTRFALAHLKQSRGCILNTASMAGVIGQSMHAAYTATKGAMIALTKSVAWIMRRSASV